MTHEIIPVSVANCTGYRNLQKCVTSREIKARFYEAFDQANKLCLVDRTKFSDIRISCEMHPCDEKHVCY